MLLAAVFAETLGEIQLLLKADCCRLLLKVLELGLLLAALGELVFEFQLLGKGHVLAEQAGVAGQKALLGSKRHRCIICDELVILLEQF